MSQFSGWTTNLSYLSKLRSEFEKQASTFNDPRHTIGSHEIMDWILKTIEPSSENVVLDVVTGTALLGRVLAKKVKKVVAIDAAALYRSQGAQGLIDAIASQRLIYER